MVDDEIDSPIVPVGNDVGERQLGEAESSDSDQTLAFIAVSVSIAAVTSTCEKMCRSDSQKYWQSSGKFPGIVAGDLEHVRGRTIGVRLGSRPCGSVV